MGGTRFGTGMDGLGLMELFQIFVALGTPQRCRDYTAIWVSLLMKLVYGGTQANYKCSNYSGPPILVGKAYSSPGV